PRCPASRRSEHATAGAGAAASTAAGAASAPDHRGGAPPALPRSASRRRGRAPAESFPPSASRAAWHRATRPWTRCAGSCLSLAPAERRARGGRRRRATLVGGLQAEIDEPCDQLAEREACELGLFREHAC